MRCCIAADSAFLGFRIRWVLKATNVEQLMAQGENLVASHICCSHDACFKLELLEITALYMKSRVRWSFVQWLRRWSLHDVLFYQQVRCVLLAWSVRNLTFYLEVVRVCFCLQKSKYLLLWSNGICELSLRQDKAQSLNPHFNKMFCSSSGCVIHIASLFRYCSRVCKVRKYKYEAGRAREGCNPSRP